MKRYGITARVEGRQIIVESVADPRQLDRIAPAGDPEAGAPDGARKPIPQCA